MKKLLIVTAVSALALIGCSSVPTQSKTDALPVVTFGEPVPDNQDFVFYFPANEPIPTNINIEGNLLVAPARDQLIVKLNKDLYVYKEWISWDKKTWHNAREALDIQGKIELPGPHHPEPGLFYLKVDEQRR